MLNIKIFRGLLLLATPYIRSYNCDVSKLKYSFVSSVKKHAPCDSLHLLSRITHVCSEISQP